jgi:hypothetical protein
MRNALAFILAVSLLAACDDPGGKVIGLDRTGVVGGIAYIDRNFDSRLTIGVDVPVEGVKAALLLEATGDTIQRATSDAGGSFRMERVPIGRYRLVADRGALGDSVQVLTIDSAQFSLAAGDTVVRLVPLGYPTFTASEIRSMAAGRKVMVRGIALNGWTAFGDSTIHVRDGTGSIRSVRVAPAPIQTGDSVRVFGTTGTRDGSVVVADAAAQVLSAAAGLPAIDSIATADAAHASGGSRADGQARIAGALILDTATVGGDFVLGVDDGSGRLAVMLDRHVPFTPAAWIPGATFSGAGVLVADGNGAWQLKPRGAAEASITFATLPISAVRALEQGRRAVIEGIALNGWAAFGDSTVHVRDATGAIRGVRVLNSVAAGDSVRLLGTVSARDGQPVLTAVTASTLLAGAGVATPDSLSTAAAASAASGTRDADQVRVGGSITGSENLNGDILLTVNDGSGPIDVLLDKDVAFTSGPYQAGALLNAVGVLVPSGSGTWRLKPARAADATAFYPTVTIVEARALQIGQTVQLVGTALNSRSTFGDATVHLEDATGSIRIASVGPQPTVLAGYTIRILGTIGSQNMMPVLNASGISQVTIGSLMAPDSVSTALAAAAEGGLRDAGQVAVSGTVSTVTTNAAGDFVLTIDDTSGALDVVLDRDVFQSNPYGVGNVIRARGVLVPVPSGTRWQLKPRLTSEVAPN